MARVVSYALWGDRHASWLLPATRAHHAIYRGWEMRVHYDAGSFEFPPCAKVVHGLRDAGLITLVPCGPNRQRCRSMLWRIKPIWEAGADIVVCRDLDSLITYDDRLAVAEWQDSGKTAHGINDNPGHNIPLMGGLCAFLCADFRRRTGIATWEQCLELAGFTDAEWDIHGADQKLLGIIYRRWLIGHTMVHRFGGTTDYDGAVMRRAARPKDGLGVAKAVMERSGRLVWYQGAAGYDVSLANAFYAEHGDPAAEARIKAIEEAAGA